MDSLRYGEDKYTPYIKDTMKFFKYWWESKFFKQGPLWEAKYKDKVMPEELQYEVYNSTISEASNQLPHQVAFALG